MTAALGIVAAVRVMAAEGSLIPSLLTGGGFVFLAAVIGGVFLLGKNASDGAKSLAEGATELVEGIRVEIGEIKKERDEIKADRDETRRRCRSCEDRVSKLDEKIEHLQAAVRALVRVMDHPDQEARDAAIARAKELI